MEFPCVHVCVCLCVCMCVYLCVDVYHVYVHKYVFFCFIFKIKSIQVLNLLEGPWFSGLEVLNESAEALSMTVTMTVTLQTWMKTLKPYQWQCSWNLEWKRWGLIHDCDSDCDLEVLNENAEMCFKWSPWAFKLEHSLRLRLRLKKCSGANDLSDSDSGLRMLSSQT